MLFHLAIRPASVSAGLYRLVRRRHRALSARLPPRHPALSLALLVTATFLFTPYILNYDMACFGFVVTLLRDRADNTKWDHRLLIALWLLPVTMMLAAAAFIPLAQVVLLAFAVRLIWRLAQDESREGEPLPGLAASASV